MARGGGGGRSSSHHSSGGGHRSSSHHSSGGSRGGSRGGFSGGYSRGTGHGGYGGGPRPGGPGPHHGPHYGPGPHYYGGRPYRRRSSGCGSLAALIMVIIIVSFAFMRTVFISSCAAVAGCASGGVNISGTTSSKEREKLDREYVNFSNQWYTDELGWIEYENDLISGMEHFYEETGIQPYLYLVDANGTMSQTEMDEFAEKAYDNLFTDEGHMLVLYFSCKDDSPWVVEGDLILITGQATELIMDDEAQKIFWSTYDYYYEDGDLSIEEFYGNTFKTAGDKIMAGPIPWRTVMIVAVVVVGVVVVVVVLVKWWKARTKQKNKEQEDLERMLDKPLETFGDSKLNDLKDKYDNN